MQKGLQTFARGFYSWYNINTKITKEELIMEKQQLALEIACALEDVFVAKVTAKEERVVLEFVGGECYELSLKKLENK